MMPNPNDAYDALLKAFEPLDGLDRKMVKRLRDRSLGMEEVLEDLLEYFRDNQDVVDGPDGQPAPDRYMRFANRIEEALKP